MLHDKFLREQQPPPPNSYVGLLKTLNYAFDGMEKCQSTNGEQLDPHFASPNTYLHARSAGQSAIRLKYWHVCHIARRSRRESWSSTFSKTSGGRSVRRRGSVRIVSPCSSWAGVLFSMSIFFSSSTSLSMMMSSQNRGRRAADDHAPKVAEHTALCGSSDTAATAAA